MVMLSAISTCREPPRTSAALRHLRAKGVVCTAAKDPDGDFKLISPSRAIPATASFEIIRALASSWNQEGKRVAREGRTMVDPLLA